jgi:predicted small secreted protein
MRRGTSRLVPLAFLVSAMLTVSCNRGGGRELPESGATLEGSVLFNGQPLEFAMVLVQGPNSSATGYIGDDGRYKIENVPLGPVKIGVNTSAARGQFQSKIMSRNAEAADPGKSKRPAQPKFVDVPANFFDPETSGLTKTIEKGANTYDIKLP